MPVQSPKMFAIQTPLKLESPLSILGHSLCGHSVKKRKMLWSLDPPLSSTTLIQEMPIDRLLVPNREIECLIDSFILNPNGCNIIEAERRPYQKLERSKWNFAEHLVALDKLLVMHDVDNDNEKDVDNEEEVDYDNYDNDDGVSFMD